MVILEITEYFSNEQLNAIDVIFLALIASLIAWVANVIRSYLFKKFKSSFKKIKSTYLLYWKLIIKKEMKLGYFAEIEEKIENEGYILKWYEKQGYYKFKEAIEQNSEELDEIINKIQRQIEYARLSTNQNIELVHNDSHRNYHKRKE